MAFILQSKAESGLNRLDADYYVINFKLILLQVYIGFHFMLSDKGLTYIYIYVCIYTYIHISIHVHLQKKHAGVSFPKSPKP